MHYILLLHILVILVLTSQISKTHDLKLTSFSHAIWKCFLLELLIYFQISENFKLYPNFCTYFFQIQNQHSTNDFYRNIRNTLLLMKSKLCAGCKNSFPFLFTKSSFVAKIGWFQRCLEDVFKTSWT